MVSFIKIFALNDFSRQTTFKWNPQNDVIKLYWHRINLSQLDLFDYTDACAPYDCMIVSAIYEKKAHQSKPPLPTNRCGLFLVCMKLKIGMIYIYFQEFANEFAEEISIFQFYDCDLVWSMENHNHQNTVSWEDG